MTATPAHMKHMPHFLGPVAPITVEAAEGSWVTDTDGNRWLDFVMGIAVVNTGHCHPKVVKAVQEQATKLAHAQMNIYRHQPMLDLAEKLMEILPEGMDQVMFANSGRGGRRERRQARQAGHPAAGHHRLPGRLPRPHAPHDGAHRLGRALPRPHEPLRRRASTTPATATRSARRPARTRRPTPSRTCAACCGPRSTATTWPPSSSSRSRARAASSCPRRSSCASCAPSPTRSAPC